MLGCQQASFMLKNNLSGFHLSPSQSQSKQLNLPCSCCYFNFFVWILVLEYLFLYIQSWFFYTPCHSCICASWHLLTSPFSADTHRCLHHSQPLSLPVLGSAYNRKYGSHSALGKWMGRPCKSAALPRSPGPSQVSPHSVYPDASHVKTGYKYSDK